MKIFIHALLLLCGLASIPSAQAKATLIYNIKGYTLSGIPGNQAQLSTFDAMVFENGKVLFTGTESDARKKFSESEEMNGQGKTLLPGLIDAHGHVLGLGESLSKVDLRGVSSEQLAVQRVAEFAKQNPQQNWITGRGWNQVLWSDKKFPTYRSLDALNIDKPIVLSRIDGHAIWANSKALALAGISEKTPDPDGGQIIRDAAGKPTGVLVDNAEFLITRIIPQLSELETNFALDKAFQHLSSLGITGVHDAGIGQNLYDIYQQRVQNHQLPVRIYAMLDGSSPQLNQWLKTGYVSDDEDRLSIRSVKLYSDGALGSRGAALLAPYHDQKDHKGLLVTQPKELYGLIEQILRANFQANIHAIGDRGNRIVLDSIEKAYGKKIGMGLRHRIEHAQVISLQDIPRLKQLDMIASMQPIHATSDMNMAEDRVGAERIKGAYAWRTLLDQGTIVASGSDFPVELANPFHGIHAAVTRQDHNNQPAKGWKAEQKMTLTEALRSFTLDAAYAAHQEQVLGSLEAGKWADFILVDRDIFEIDQRSLWQVNVLETWVAGEQVFHKAL